ncbi:MAG TPA: FKBP-type peptidyl-prolyl cis-trans isomerase [Fimbriimonadaceae bacterium]|nr:FKBP-type peptidyl-prolyl cis-trans isomerase [Fimbriimonadaceae bacterium]
MKPSFLIASIAAVALLSGCDSQGTSAKSTEEAKPATAAVALTELKKEDVKVGTGTGFPKGNRPAQKGDRVFVLYTGTRKDGVQFDSNDKVGGNPFDFVLGEGSVIQGWEEGIVGMIPGGVRKLSIPSKMGYGEHGSGEKIPPNTDLYFEVKLLDVVKAGEGSVFDKIDVKPGTGPAVRNGDTVSLHYDAMLTNGKPVDSTRDRGKPLTFKVGTAEVIPGLDAGVVGMKAGGVRKLRVPPDIAFRSGEATGLVYFDVELLKIGK